MRLQFDLFKRGDGLRAIPVVFHHDIIDDEDTVQSDSHTVAHHFNVHRVPFAQPVVCHGERFARMRLVVIQSARSDLRTDVDTRRIPHLYLRRAAQIDAGIGFLAVGVEHPVYVHLEVAVWFLGTDIVVTRSVEDEQAVFHFPVATHGLVGFGLLFSQLGRFHLCAADRISDEPFPSGQVFAVEERNEALCFRHLVKMLADGLTLIVGVGVVQ